MSNDFDKFVDAFIEHAMKTTGMTREELLKGWSVDGAPAPVIEVGDTLTVGEGDECEHKVLAHPTEDFWCVSGYDKLFNWHDLNSHFELIRKGPKVHTFEGVEWVKCDGDTDFARPKASPYCSGDTFEKLGRRKARGKLTFTEEDTK